MMRSAARVFGLAALPAAPSSAKVTRLDVSPKQPYGSFRRGQYVNRVRVDAAVIVNAAETPLFESRGGPAAPR